MHLGRFALAVNLNPNRFSTSSKGAILKKLIDRLKGMLQGRKISFTSLIPILRSLLGAVFGEIKYEPPAWIRAFGNRLEQSFFGTWYKSARDRVQSNPDRSRKIAIRAVTLSIILYGVYFGVMQYLDSLPKPEYVTVSISAPQEPDLQSRTPKNLSIFFGGSAAKFEHLDKPLPSEGFIEIQPKIAGRWRWLTATQLEFRPAEAWKIASKYTVKFERDLFPSHVLLKEMKFDFHTPQLRGRLSKSEFYQDPRDPNVKKAVFNFVYNYPIDTEDFKKRIRLSMRTVDEKVLGSGAKNLPYTVAFGPYKNEAYVLSEVIAIPKSDSIAEIAIEKGVKGELGGVFDSDLRGVVSIPGLFDKFKFSNTLATFARNEKFEPEQIVILNSQAEIATEELAKSLKLWLLPPHKTRPYWNSPMEVTDEVRPTLKPLKFVVVPAAAEHSLSHSLKVDVPANQSILVEVPAGIRSYGGYELQKKYEAVVRIPEYPHEMMIMSKGAILSMSGDKKVPFLGRNVAEVHYRLHRVLPEQLNQFVFNSFKYGGSLAQPQISIPLETMSEVFKKSQKFTNLNPAKTQYFSLDIEPYLKAAPESRRGLFVLSAVSNRGKSDSRLIMLTDLGMIVKESNGRTQTVFVQDLKTGGPVVGAEVEVLGINGIKILSQRTDANGSVVFPDLAEFKEEKQPAVFVAKRGGDFSFLPFQMPGRSLSYSKFDVGGVHESSDSDQLTAFMFSDRGIYRPGDTANFGLIVRAKNWKRTFSSVPVLWIVTDSRGAEVHREKREIDSSDLLSLSLETKDFWPTGTYNIQIQVARTDRSFEHIGSHSIRIEEFLPDRMRISATIEGAKPQGWVAPENLKGRIVLKNLFGTPAENRRVVAELSLEPARPFFRKYSEFEFAIPTEGHPGGYSEPLPNQMTDSNGETTFDFNLERFSKGMYTLSFEAEGFEANGGRAVSANASTLISTNEYLVGLKSTDSLNFIPKGSVRKVSVIAINSNLETTAVSDIEATIFERRYVSTLMRQSDGTYSYQSVRKETSREPTAFSIAAKGSDFTLPTNVPGDFVLVLKNKAGESLNRIEFSVAGQANLTRDLEKNAELQVRLNKTDYKPGEEISIQIKAPYAGAGIITIERDKVYATRWFKTDTTSTVETIRIPEGLEGNAYVNVSFLRSIDSNEIFMSPLSYAVMPFSISLSDHQINLKVNAPATVKPGEPLKILYSSARPTKAILYGVDEGILQVSKYKLPDPLTYFFQRRALQVKTFQLLDLLLPEYSVLQKLSAPGGDEEMRLSRNLNPFKRKTDKPVVFWSGVVDVGPTAKEYIYHVPDYFNGNIKVMAVAAQGASFGASEQSIVSRGDFIISPNLPTFVVPGDEIVVGVGLANQADGTGPNAKVKLDIKVPSEAFEVLGETSSVLEAPEGRETATTFRLRAKGKFGSAAIRFEASSGSFFAKSSVEASVRPALPYMTDIQSGVVASSEFQVPVLHKLAPDFRKQTASVSPVPMVLGDGLKVFLENYPYGCTEQITSKLFPAIVLSAHADFKIDKAAAKSVLDSTIAIYRTRIASDGGIGMYTPDSGANIPATIYVAHMLLEAKDRGFQVPDDLLSSLLGRLESVRATGTLDEARTFAYALYLRARGGRVPGNDLSFLLKAVETNHRGGWEQDLLAGWLAATFRLVKKDDEAKAIFSKIKIGEKTRSNYDYFYDGFVRDTALLFIGAKHFPEYSKSFASDESLKKAFSPLVSQQYNTHSAAFSLLALDAIFSIAARPEIAAQIKISEVLPKGQKKQLLLAGNTVVPKSEFSSFAEKIEYAVPKNIPFYFSQVQSGFEAAMPKVAIGKNLEIVRDYLNAGGEVVTKTKVGEIVNVRLRARATSRTSIRNVVIVDLLPSGFEPVLEVVQPEVSSESSEAEDEYQAPVEEYEEEYVPEDQPEEGAFQRIIRNLVPEAVAQSVTSAGKTLLAAFSAEYVDRREDRVIIYGTVTGDITEFTYRVRAIAEGKFVVPPPFAESMYERDVKYRGVPAAIEVEAP